MRAGEQEADRAAVYADMWEDEWICEAGALASQLLYVIIKRARQAGNGYSHLWSRRTVGR